MAVMLLVVGCSSGASHRTPVAVSSLSTQVTTLGPSPTASPLCRSVHPAGRVVLALPGGRRAVLVVPRGRGRRALVMVLPGYGETSEQLAIQTRLPDRALRTGVVAVLPQGAGPKLSWNFSGTTGYDDLGLLSRLLTTLVRDDCVDPNRVVLAGISDGGDMAAFAACALPGRFRAVVTVAASILPRHGCPATPILAIHGDADPLDPYGGGRDGRPGYPAIPPAETAIASWAAVDGCKTSSDRRVGVFVHFRTYPCGAELVTINGGGHTWPGGMPSTASMGRTSSEYDATEAVLHLTAT